MNSNWSCSQELPNLGKNRRFCSHVILKFDGWPSKTRGHLFYATSSSVHHFVAIGEFKLELQSGNAQSGSNSVIFFFIPCDLEIWQMTLKNNRAPLLSNIKLCASTYVNSNWSYNPETAKWGHDLCDLNHWPLTLTFCMDITSVIGSNSWKLHDDTMKGT